MREIYLKLTIKTPKGRKWCRSSDFIINFERFTTFSVSTTDFEQVNIWWDAKIKKIISLIFYFRYY